MYECWLLSNGICTRSIEGVVTYMSLVEVLVTAIKFFDWQKVCLIAWSFPFEAVDRFAWFPRIKGQIAATHSWLLQFRGHLDLLPKRAWFNFDPGCKRFYTGHLSDYPLSICGQYHDDQMVSTQTYYSSIFTHHSGECVTTQAKWILPVFCHDVVTTFWAYEHKMQLCSQSFVAFSF